MESSRVMCPHCDFLFYPEEGVTVDDCPVCGRTVEVQPAPAPLPGSEELAEALAEISAAGLGGVAEGMRLHISDLTRRLAEAEHFASYAVQAVIDFAHLEREDYPDGMTLEQMREAMQTHLDEVEAQVERRAEAAEARVRELEATIDAMAEAHAHDDMALTAAYLSGAHEGKKQAEAFKARVMEWARGQCGACEHEGSEGATCYDCNSDDERSNWTPPQAWEVKP